MTTDKTAPKLYLMSIQCCNCAEMRDGINCAAIEARHNSIRGPFLPSSRVQFQNIKKDGEKTAQMLTMPAESTTVVPCHKQYSNITTSQALLDRMTDTRSRIKKVHISSKWRFLAYFIISSFTGSFFIDA